MTSNVGANKITEQRQSLGFGADSDENKNIEGTLLLIGFDSQNEERHETK
jgi:hypothetical protein